MTDARFYRIAVLAPLVLPVVVGLLAYIASGPFLVPAVVLVGSLIYAGPAYALFAAGVLLWSRGTDERAVPRLRRLLPIAPLLFAPLAMANVAVARVLTGDAGTTVRSTIPEGAQVAVLAVLLGYIYAGGVQLLNVERKAVRRRSSETAG